MGFWASRTLRSECGFTLVELLVTIPIALAVAGAIMGLTGVFNNNEKDVANRSAAIESAQVALDRMTRDIRQASSVTTKTSATTTGSPGSILQLTTLVYDSSTSSRKQGTVTWDCSTVVVTGSLWSCSRAVTISSTTTTSSVLLYLSGSNTPFVSTAATTNAGTYVTINLTVPTDRSVTTGTPTASSATFALTGGAAPLN